MTQFLAGYSQAGAPSARAEPVVRSSERYEDLGLVSQGGMGEVRRVRDRDHDRVVAMKVIREGSGSLGDLVSRFLREAHLTARLQHPGIVAVYEIGRNTNGMLYYTMPLVAGRTLAAALIDARTPADRFPLLGAFADVCHAIAYAHDNGVVHRDLKPANIIVGAFGETVVLDWGLAKVRDEDEVAPGGNTTDTGGTSFGTVLGTPGYLSPEQARGDTVQIDERSDVWALGAILFEILTGRTPFVGHPVDIVVATARDPAPGVRQIVPDAPADLAAVADKALARDPSLRYADARELAREIDSWRSGLRVAAYAYSAGEIAWRFVVQHRVPVGILVAATCAVLGVTVASFDRVRNERDAATARGLTAEAGRKQLAGAPHEAVALARAASWVDKTAKPWATALTLEELERKGGLVRLLDAQEDWGTTLDVSPDGRLLAAGGADGVVVVYDVLSGATRHRLRGPVGWVWSVAFSPDGRSLAAGGDDGHVWIFDVATGEAVRSPAAHSGRNTLVRFAPDGTRIASASDDGSVRLSDAVTGALIAEARVAEGADQAVALAFAPDGSSLITGSPRDGGLVFSVPGLTRLLSLGAGSRAFSVAVSNDTFATGGVSGELAIWSSQGELLHSADVSADRVQALAFSPDGATLGFLTKDEARGTMAARTGTVSLLTGAPAGGGLEIRFVPSRDWMVLFSGGVQIWDYRSGTLLGTYDLGTWQRGFALDPGGRWFATTGGLQATSVVTPWLEEPPLVLGAETQRGWSYTWSPDGRWIVGTGGDGALRTWVAETGEARLRLPKAHDHLIAGVGWLSPDRFVTASWDNTVKAWSPGGHEPVWTHAFSHSSIGMRYAAISPDHTMILAGGSEPDSRVLDASDGSLVATLRSQGSGGFAAAWSPAGDIAGVADDLGGVDLWSTTSWEHLRAVDLDVRSFSMAFTPSGNTVLIGTGTSFLAFDVATGAPVVLPEALAAASRVAFASAAPRAASSSGATITVWDPANWSVIRVLDAAPEAVAVSELSADGRLVVAGAGRRTWSWDADTGHLLHAAALSSAALAPQGTRAAMAGVDGTSWVVDLARPVDVAARWLAFGVANNYRVCPDDLRVVVSPESGPDEVFAPAALCESR